MRLIKLLPLSWTALVLESEGVGLTTLCSEPLLLLDANHRVQEMPHNIAYQLQGPDRHSLSARFPLERAGTQCRTVFRVTPSFCKCYSEAHICVVCRDDRPPVPTAFVRFSSGERDLVSVAGVSCKRLILENPKSRERRFSATRRAVAAWARDLLLSPTLCAPGCHGPPTGSRGTAAPSRAASSLPSRGSAYLELPIPAPAFSANPTLTEALPDASLRVPASPLSLCALPVRLIPSSCHILFAKHRLKGFEMAASLDSPNL